MILGTYLIRNRPIVDLTASSNKKFINKREVSYLNKVFDMPIKELQGPLPNPNGLGFSKGILTMIVVTEAEYLKNSSD